MPDRIIEPVTRKALQMSVTLDLNGMSQDDALNKCAEIINSWVRDKYGRIFDIPENPGDLSNDLLFCGIDTAFQKKRYCLRAWEIDEKEPYRVWLTESEVAAKGLSVRLAVRVSYSFSPARIYPVIYSVPKFVKTIRDQFGFVDVVPFTKKLHVLEGSEAIDDMSLLISANDRFYPVVAVSESRYQNCGADPEEITEYLSGKYAHVVLIPKKSETQWENIVGKGLAVYGGSVRTYYPDYESDVKSRTPYTTFRDIVTSSSTDEKEGITYTAGSAYSRILKAKILNRLLNDDIDWEKYGNSFSLRNQGNVSSNDRISALIQDNKKLQQEYNEKDAECKDEQKRTEDYRSQLETYKAQCHNLAIQKDGYLELLKNRGIEEKPDIIIPDNYEEMEDWVDKYLSGKLILHNRAKRALKDARYKDVERVYRCLLMLGNEYRDSRLNKCEYDKYRNESIRLGVDIAKTGDGLSEHYGDDYYVNYNGAKVELKYHLKRGNAKDDAECLRIYYFWDEDNQVVVIGWLPSHLRTPST